MRELEKINGLLEWVGNHTNTLEEYARALKQAGFTIEETFRDMVEEIGESVDDTLCALEDAGWSIDAVMEVKASI